MADSGLGAIVSDAQGSESNKAGASSAAFAAILQAARKTPGTSALDAGKTAAGVISTGKAPFAAVLQGTAEAQGTVPARTAGQPSILEETASPVITAPVIRKAPLAAALEGKAKAQGTVPARTAAQPATLEKTALPVMTVSGDAGALQKAPPQAATLKMASREPTTQLPDQIRNPIQPDVAPDSGILRQSWLASVQSTASAAGQDGSSPRPVAGRVVGKKAIQQAGPAQGAKAAAGGAQAEARKLLGTLLHGAGRSAGFAAEEQTGRSGMSRSNAGRIGAAADIAQVGAPAAEAARPGSPGPSSPANQIAEAFQSSAARNGQKIVIRLNPPELGQVRVMLRAEGSEVRGVLEADNPRTLSQLQREAPIIMNRLAEAGIQMKRMDLSLSDSGTGDPALFSQPQGRNGTEHGGWDAPSQSQAADDTPPGGPDTEDQLAPATITIENDSINVWI